jgi:hypothetical protein
MQFFGFLLLVGFIAAYFWWIAATLVAVGLVYYGYRRRLAGRYQSQFPQDSCNADRR